MYIKWWIILYLLGYIDYYCFKLRNLKFIWNFFRVVGIIIYVLKLNRKKNIIENIFFYKKISLLIFYLLIFLVVDNIKLFF